MLYLCIVLFILSLILLPVIFLFIQGCTGDAVFVPDQRQIALIYNSLVISILTAVFSCFIGFLYAFFIIKTNVYGRTILFWLSIIPAVIPPYIYTIAIKGMLPVTWLNGYVPAIAILTCSFFPFAVVILMCGLRAIVPACEEAGLLTSSPSKVVRTITLPLLFPYIAASFIICFVMALSNYSVPSLMQLNVYTVEIFIQFSAFYNYNRAVLMCIPLVLFTIILVLLQKQLMGNRSYVVIDAGIKKVYQFSLQKMRVLISVCLCVFLGLVVLVPLISLLVQAGGMSTYQKILSSSMPELVTSFMSAVSAAFVCVVISFVIAYYIVQNRTKMSKLLDTISVIPFALPPTIVGIALIRFWNRPWLDFLYGNSFMLLVAYTTITCPFAIRILCSRMRSIHPDLLHASCLIGAGVIKRFRTIFIPLVAPGLRIAWAAAFILSMRELGCTLLVIPPGKETVPLKLYTLMHYGAGKIVAGLSIILITVTIIPLAVLYYGFNRERIKTV